MRVSMQQAVKSIGIIGCMLLFSAAIGIGVHVSGYALLQNAGLSYFFHYHPDKYAITHQTIPDGYSVEIDLSDLDSNVGKRIWENGNQYIEIASVDTDDYYRSDYRIFFRSYGFYDMSGGKLTSGIEHTHTSEGYYSYNTAADLVTTYNGVSYPGHWQGMTCLNWANGIKASDYLGFYLLLPEELFDENGVPLTGNSKATVTLYNLTEHTWTRI